MSGTSHCISSNISGRRIWLLVGKNSLLAASFSGLIDDYRQRQWYIPPGCPKPCHTLLDGWLSFVSGNDADSVLDCCLCRKQRRTKWSVSVKLHHIDGKWVSGEMALRLATCLWIHPQQSVLFHFLCYYLTGIIPASTTPSICYVMYLLIKDS